MRRISFYAFFILSFLLQIGSNTASASPVYTGCSPAVGSPTGNVWYVDPVNGSMQGDGSQAHPWQTLAGVVAAGLFANMPTHWNSVTQTVAQNNPNAPIRSGDTIYLMSGNHGSVVIQGYFGGGLVGYNNTSFITIVAAPGQTPVIQNLSIIGASKWIFRGLTIQGLNTSGVYLTSLNNVPDTFLVSLTGPHQDIILDGNTITSTGNISNWALSDWITSRSSGVDDVGGTCVSITNNMLRNIGFGIITRSSDRVLISNNLIDRFTDDGIDFGSSDLLIQNNRIYNSVEDGDGLHRDGMQGQPVVGQTVVNNITIDSNTVIRLYSGGTNFPGYLQGIDAFDGIWINMTITNNVVITDAYDALAFYGANNSLIQGNIVLADSGKLLPCFNLNLAACLSQVLTYDTSTTPLIVVHSAKIGMPSTNVSVTQNITSGLQMDPNDPAVTVNQNLCVQTAQACAMSYLVNHQLTWYTKAGAYQGGNVITNSSPAQLFQQFDTTLYNYNLTLIQPNPAISN